MIYESVELHNVAEVKKIDGQGGVRMQRVPESVRDKLTPRTQEKMLGPAGAEIRFVTQEDRASVTLSSSKGKGTATVFFGPFYARKEEIIGSQPKTINIEFPCGKLGHLSKKVAEKLYFSPKVCRIVLRKGNIHLHNVKGNVRLPDKSQTPSLQMLSYGTSITHGMAASAFHLSYAAQTAFRLRVDLVNLGVGGACFCEPVIADYIAQRSDWQFATLCLSVNMLNSGFTTGEFKERTSYLIKKIAESDPHRLIFCISILPFFTDWTNFVKENTKATPNEFRQILADVVASLNLPNVHLIEGPDLLTYIGGLTCDLIHPSDFGMIQIAENLAARLKPLVKNLY